MRRPRITRLAGLAAVVLCLPLLAVSAEADRNDRGRDGHHARRAHRDVDPHRGRGYHRQHNRPKVGIDFRLSFGDRRGYSRPHGPAYVIRGDRCGGFWKRVYCPPVYRTYYDDCGRRVRKCVQAGYWKKIWVRY